MKHPLSAKKGIVFYSVVKYSEYSQSKKTEEKAREYSKIKH